MMSRERIRKPPKRGIEQTYLHNIQPCDGRMADHEINMWFATQPLAVQRAVLSHGTWRADSKVAAVIMERLANQLAA